MNSDSILLVFIMAILVLMSGFFSAAETAFSSANRVRLKNIAGDGNKKAQRAMELIENFDTVLSTILIGNNIVNIACTSIATLVFTGLLGDDVGVTASTVVMTVVVLVFGEVTPKSIAKEKAESFAMAAAPIIKALIIILTPINFLFKQWKKLISKIFKLGRVTAVTEDELITYVDEAQSGGEIDSDEGELIRCAIEFNDLDVSDILTPRVDVVAVEKTDGIDEISKVFHDSRYTRLPVFVGDIDHVIGVIYERDFRKAQDKGLKNIKTIIKPIQTVSDNMKISDALRQFQKTKTHLAVVIDEFGGTMGVVTLEDVLEQLVGEIWDEYDDVTEDFTENEDGSFNVSALMSLDKFAEMFNVDCDDYEVTTVGGLVMDELDKIAEIGDVFNFNNLKITVLDVESRRVLLTKVEKIGEKNNGDI